MRYSPADDQYRQNVCGFWREDQKAFEHGLNATNYKVVGRIGQAALLHPRAPSHYFQGLNNRAGALYYVSHTFTGTFNAWYHFNAGAFNKDGVATGLAYSPPTRVFGLLQHASPWESEREFVTGYKIQCGRPDPLVDNLQAITVPVLYLAAAGGFGTTGEYSLGLLGSTDISEVLVRLHPVGDEALDFAHVDLWQGSNAPDLVWNPLTTWLKAH